jgi:hypothetical protein
VYTKFFYIFIFSFINCRRKLNNEEFPNFCRSNNIVRVIKSRRLIWAGHVARMEEGRPRSDFKVLIGKPKVRDH